jgi:hypothetical protein
MTLIGRWWSAIKSLPTRLATWLVSPGFDEDVETIRLATCRLCRFFPTAATVANILAIGNPALMTASAIAGAICAAVTRKQNQQAFGLVGRNAPPTVEGIVIEGEWKFGGH